MWKSNDSVRDIGVTQSPNKVKVNERVSAEFGESIVGLSV